MLTLLLPCHICFINIKLLIALLLKTFTWLKNDAGLPYIVSNAEYKAIYACFIAGQSPILLARLPLAHSARGTEPHTHRIWSTSFLLVVT